MKDAGISKLDHVLITHFHTDHVGGVPNLVERVQVGEFLDHGVNREDSDITRHDYAAYLKAIEGKRRRVVHPGDTIDIPGLSTIVLTADGEHIARGAGRETGAESLLRERAALGPRHHRESRAPRACWCASASFAFSIWAT